MCIGTTPPRAMFARAMETPRPFKPGNLSTNAVLMAALKMVEVFPGTLRPEYTKSSTVTVVAL